MQKGHIALHQKEENKELVYHQVPSVSALCHGHCSNHAHACMCQPNSANLRCASSNASLIDLLRISLRIFRHNLSTKYSLTSLHARKRLNLFLRFPSS